MLTKLNRVWSLQPLKSRVLDTKKSFRVPAGSTFKIGSGRAFLKLKNRASGRVGLSKKCSGRVGLSGFLKPDLPLLSRLSILSFSFPTLSLLALHFTCKLVHQKSLSSSSFSLVFLRLNKSQCITMYFNIFTPIPPNQHYNSPTLI